MHSKGLWLGASRGSCLACFSNSYRVVSKAFVFTECLIKKVVNLPGFTFQPCVQVRNQSFGSWWLWILIVFFSSTLRDLHHMVSGCLLRKIIVPCKCCLLSNKRSSWIAIIETVLYVHAAFNRIFRCAISSIFLYLLTLRIAAQDPRRRRICDYWNHDSNFSNLGPSTLGMNLTFVCDTCYRLNVLSKVRFLS